MRNSLCAALLVVGASFLAIDRADAAVFNLRASLQNGYYVSGTVAVDAATGVVSAENTTLFRNGVALSTFGGPGSQGPFTPGGGVAPSYLFGSSGSNGYLFVGAVPGTSLVGYGGGELCSLVSAVRCAFSDLFFGGSDIANAVQGALLPVADAIRTFSLTGTFENGYSVTGTVVIDVTAGFVLDQRATLFSNGIVVDEFYNPLSQAVFAPGGGVAPSYLFGSVGAGGVLLNLGVPGTSLVGYGGGDLCASGNGQTCAFSDIFVDPRTSFNAVSARLVGPRAVPEPSVLALIMIGVVGCGIRRRVR